MADEEQLKIIKQGPDAWNRWRAENPKIIPDLVEADLRGFKLENIDLHRAVMKSAKLQFSNFFGANLEEACLEKAKLQESILTGANLKSAKISEASMLESNLQNANMENSDLRGVQFNEDTIFENANLKGANLINATGIDEGQLSVASTDGRTLLPAYLDDEIEGEDFLKQL